MKDNVIENKSKEFALRIIKLYKFLNGNNEFVLSKQVLRSGTSIGANVNEAICAQSKADFYAKLYNSYKEANETNYWLELLYKSDYINKEEYISLKKDCKELIRILASITKTQKISNC